MSSISSLIRRSLLLFSFIFAFQFIFLPSAQAITPWSLEPWEGESWEIPPWDFDGSTEGESWDGSTTEDGGPGDDSTGDSGDDGPDTMCLPLPPNDWGDYIPRDSASITDQEKEEFYQEITNELVSEHPMLRQAILNDPEGYVEQLEEALDDVLDRPYGTINDVDIPSDVMATLADAGYSDEKLNDPDRADHKTQESYEEFLRDHGWKEMGYREHWSGFRGRVFVNEEDGTIAFSFGGTEYIRDYLADGELATGRDPLQYEQAEKFVDEMMKRYPNYQPVVTGHSLGGAIAQHISLEKKIPAATFNAPGIGTREYSFGDVLKDGKWYAKPLSIPLSAFIKDKMNEGSLPLLVDQANRSRFYDDLVENNIMEDDEIGMYQIHIGQTNVYTDDGDAYIKYDYSDDAHHEDLPATKAYRTGKDIWNKLPSHGIDNFRAIMHDC